MKRVNQLSTIQEFTNSLVNYLQTNSPKASGNLSKSFNGGYTIDGIEIGGLDYFKFIEQGVNGTEQSWGSTYSFSKKMIPISTIQSYADERGINVYALQKSIFKKGIKPKDIITSKLNNKLDDFGDDFLNSMWDDFKLDNPNETIK